MTRTLTTEQLRARAKFWREKAVEAKWESVSIAQDMLQNADAFDELAANREAQPVMYASEETLAYAKEGEKSLVTWSEPMGDAVIPLFTAPPAPAVPPEKKLPELMMASYHEAIGWNACRAAMLAQPVSSGYKLPDGWIACSEQMPAVGEHDWRTALPVLVKCEIGVIPAYYGFTYHEGEQCFGFMESVKFGDASGSGPEQHENRLMMHVTHWMPLPAAPEGGNAD